MKRTLILSLMFLQLPVGFISYAEGLKESVTWNEICNNPAPLSVMGHLRQVNSDLSKPSYWSVGCETLDRGYSDFEKYKEFVGRTGVGYGRLQSGWAKTEQEKGKYDFLWLDKQVDGLLEQGVHPWICLCYGNPAYSDDGYDLNAKLFGDGPVMDAWLHYVKTIVKRYKGKVAMWEVWNEPDYTKGLPFYATYANLFVRTAKAIRDVDPNAKIAAFGACAPNRDRQDYMKKCLDIIKERGALKYIDYITYHPYYELPELVNPSFLRYKEMIASYSDKIELVQGETGCPGQLEFGHALKDRPWTEYSQAKWDLRQMMNHFGLGVRFYNVFTMVDLNYGWMMQSFGLVRMQLDATPVYLRPKFYAVQHITSLITPDITPDNTVTIKTECGRKVACVGLKKDGKTIGCALWLSDRRPSDSLERQKCPVEIDGVKFEKPVYVDMLDGKVYSLGIDRLHGAFDETTTIIPELPLWDSPIVLINRADVPMDK